MEPELSNSTLYINLAALRQNVARLLHELPAGAALVPVLKDDAYGLGAIPVARVLADFEGIAMLAVATVGEGAALRAAGFMHDILVMGGIPGRLAGPAVAHQLTVTVGRPELAELLARQAAAQNRRVRVQVKLETGLHRMGVTPGAELAALARELDDGKAHLEVTGAFSHLADAEDARGSEAQYQSFLAGVAQLRAAGIAVPMRHIAASAALEAYPHMSLDAVRVGRRLYLDRPGRPTGAINEVASWRSWVTGVRQLAAGERVGYGGQLRLRRNSTVATIAVGFGDGVNTELVKAGAPVLIGGQRAPLLGCCMDQCFADVSGIDCRADDEVTLLGHSCGGQLLPAQQVAALAGKEGCDLTACLAKRVARVYTR